MRPLECVGESPSGDLLILELAGRLVQCARIIEDVNSYHSTFNE